MGISFSCPFADLDDVDTRFESLLVRSISFNGVESENSKMKSVGSRKMILEGSLSFKGRELETTISFRSSSTNIEKDNVIVRSFSHNKGREMNDGLLLSSEDCLSESTAVKPCLEAGNERHQAALKLQKTYKSFRTRRQLADCAVLVEQRWWKLLDFAELKRSSISFFDIEKPETAVSRWSRARTRAAKVGKGLSKDEKARKLALQHWLEAIDPRHRYGHNLQFYYVEWLQCESRQPFFYWLDIGEGKDVILERCTRSKLHQQCIKYLGPVERKGYEVGVEEGKLIYKESGKFLETRGGPEDAKWIFVLSASRTLYVGMKIKGQFQHSSFLAGGATLSAGRLVVEDGVLKAVWPHSGHYLPTEENFEAFMLFLKEHHVDLSTVQKSPRGEDEVSFSRNENSFGLRNSTSEPDFCRSSNETSDVKTGPAKHYCDDAENYRPPSSKWSRELRSKITSLKIPKRPNNFQISIEEEEEEEEECHSDGYETGDEPETEFTVAKRNLFDEEEEEEEEESIPKEKIVQRINSHKGMKSYQLAQQLSCKWTTGAGPRIGCLRDYPSELQCRALEEANLSPRGFASSPRKTTLRPSPRGLTPTGLCRETNSGRSPLAGEKQVILYQTNTP